VEKALAIRQVAPQRLMTCSQSTKCRSNSEAGLGHRDLCTSPGVVENSQPADAHLDASQRHDGEDPPGRKPDGQACHAGRQHATNQVSTSREW